MTCSGLRGWGGRGGTLAESRISCRPSAATSPLAPHTGSFPRFPGLCTQTHQGHLTQKRRVGDCVCVCVYERESARPSDCALSSSLALSCAGSSERSAQGGGRVSTPAGARPFLFAQSSSQRAARILKKIETLSKPPTQSHRTEEQRLR